MFHVERRVRFRLKTSRLMKIQSKGKPIKKVRNLFEDIKEYPILK
jgi:hypothetical protein